MSRSSVGRSLNESTFLTSGFGVTNSKFHGTLMLLLPSGFGSAGPKIHGISNFSADIVQ
jgi:hypothetical protein